MPITWWEAIAHAEIATVFSSSPRLTIDVDTTQVVPADEGTVVLRLAGRSAVHASAHALCVDERRYEAVPRDVLRVAQLEQVTGERHWKVTPRG